MGLTRLRSRRKPTGGLYHQRNARKKKISERRNVPILTKMGATKVREMRGRGGMQKLALLSVDVVNAYDPKTKKYVQAKIKTVTENPANRHYVRRNIITKGTIVDTDKGKAKITSRPGQEGALNGVLI